MRRLTGMLGIIIVILLLLTLPLGAVVGLVWVVRLVLERVFAMEADVLRIWLPTLGTILGGVIGIMVNKQWERRREREARRLELRSRLYDPLVTLLFAMLNHARTSGLATVPDEYQSAMQEQSRSLLLGGSDAVVARFIDIQSFDYTAGTLENYADQVSHLIVAIRNEMGHSEGQLHQRHVLQIFGLASGDAAAPIEGGKRLIHFNLGTAKANNARESERTLVR